MLRFVTPMTLVLLAGCGSDPKPRVTTAPTTSGGLATIDTGRSVIGFVPRYTELAIVTLDGDTSKSGVLPIDPAALSVPISFGVDSCAADAAHAKVVCVGYDSSKVAILDIADFLSTIESAGTPSAGQIAELEVDLGNTETVSISGGECVNCGVLTDPDADRFIISSGDGVRVLDYTGAVIDSYLSDAERSFTTENFGFDAAHHLVISPEYETTNNYLWVIDLDTHRPYRWTRRLVDQSTDPVNGLPVLVIPMTADSASIDPSTQIVTIGDEFTTTLLVLDLSSAKFDDSSGTFTDDAYSLVALDNVASTGGLLTTGQAIDPKDHVLFLEEEFGAGIGVVELPATGGAGPVALRDQDYTSALVPDASAVCPGVTSWMNVGDPHGLSLFTGRVDGREKGLLIDESKTCLAVIDLDTFAAAPELSGTNTAASLDGIVRFVAIGSAP